MKIEEIIAGVREKAAKSPTNVYQADNCLYNGGNCSDGSIGCIFGQVLKDLGQPVDEGDEGRDIIIILGILGIESSSLQKQWCGSVQDSQDFGIEWKKAVDKADDTYSLGDTEPIFTF